MAQDHEGSSPPSPHSQHSGAIGRSGFYGFSGLRSAPGGVSNVSQNQLLGKSLHEFKEQIHSKLVQMVNLDELQKVPDQRRRNEIRQALERLIDADRPLLATSQRERLIEDILDDVFGLGPLEKLLRDPTINDILVNSPTEVFVERRGVLESADVTFRDNAHLMLVIDRIVSRVGRRVDEASPMVDARLPDGSRVNAIIPPIALRGPALSIRRFGANPLRQHDLLNLKSITQEMLLLIEAAVKARLNILISGGTGSGKTTLLNILANYIPSQERVITLEDAAELQLQRPHVVQLETRPPNIEGRGEVLMKDLVRNALRMRPNRIIVGECRGGEALDMLQAMNTGHEGSLTTLHANSPRDALTRLEIMILMAGVDFPMKAIRQQIASAIHLVVQIDRLQDGTRKITHVSEVVGLEKETIVLQNIFAYNQLDVDESGRVIGQYEATGVKPNFLPRLKVSGVGLPPDLFEMRILD